MFYCFGLPAGLDIIFSAKPVPPDQRESAEKMFCVNLRASAVNFKGIFML